MVLKIIIDEMQNLKIWIALGQLKNMPLKRGWFKDCNEFYDSPLQFNLLDEMISLL